MPTSVPKRGTPTAGEWLWVAELLLGQHEENLRVCARRRVPLWQNGTDELRGLRNRAREAGVTAEIPYEIVD